jgi:hypothetical protein
MSTCRYGLQQVVFRSVPQGFRGNAFVAYATQDQGRYVRSCLLELTERVETLAVGERQIGEDRPCSFLAQSLHALREGLGAFTLEWATIRDE